MSLLANDPETQNLLALPRRQARGSAPVVVLPAEAGSPSAIAGGAYEGASRIDREVALWSPNLNSVDADILPDKDMADARSRDSLRNDAFVAGGDAVLKDGIVGSLFALNAKPNSETLKTQNKAMDDTWAEEFQAEAENKFTLAVESNDNWIDAERKNTLTEMVRLALGVHLMGGEVLASAEWIREAYRPFSTAIKMIDLDRLSTPPGKKEDRFLKAGVAKDRYGAPIGYHIRQAHPSDWMDAEAYQWSYVPARKPWGRRQIIHIFENTRPDQTRGVSAMVSMLSEMRMTKRFRRTMLENAIVNATYAATIESDMPSEAIYQALGGGNLSQAEITKLIQSYGAGYLASVSAYIGERGHKLDGVKVPHLFPGTRLNLRPAGQGGPLGTEFEQSLLRYIAANLGISYEQLSKDYSNSNYSSTKAALAETEKFMNSRKKIIADRFATFVYALWLEEAISRGEITSLPRNAPLFWEGLNKEAYTACEWVGASQGQIDELKETQAAALRIRNHLSTYEIELGKLGRDWRKVFKQAEIERKLMEDRGLVLEADNMLNAASGEARQTENADA